LSPDVEFIRGAVLRDRGLRRWRALVRERARAERHDLARDVLDELASHLADVEASALHDGASAAEATRAALATLDAASFGNLAHRSRARGPRAIGDRLPALARDLRFAFRQLRRSPGFTATALVTLAIGIGANTAVFTLVHAVLLASLPVAHADRLYKLGDEYRCCPLENLQGSWSIFSYPFYLEVRDHVRDFEEVAAMDTLRWPLSVRRAGDHAAAPFTGEFVSGNYFSTLGVQAFAGRLIGPGDDRAGAPPVVVASYAAWQKYGFDASLVGRPLEINGISMTLAGAAPPAFFGDRLESRPPDFWIPLSLEPAVRRESTLLEAHAAGWLYIVGRLRDGANAQPLQAQLTTALRNYLRAPGHINQQDERKKIDTQVVRLTPAGGGINAMKADYDQALYLLLAVSAAVLLIACANLANLLLARGAGQRVRTAVELAMGASRRQVLRRHLIESLVLASGGGVAGLATAVAASRAIVILAFRGAPHVPIDTTPSVAVLFFTCGVSLATGLLFGLGPAWVASRSDPADALRGSSRVIADAARPQRALVVLQAALSLALVTVAVLLTESLRNLDRQTLGFEPGGRLIVEIDPQSAGYTQPRLDALYRRLDDRLSRVPGVVSESLSLYTAQQGNSWGARIFVEGTDTAASVSWDRVGARYFDTIGTPILRGRGIGDEDTADSRRVAVVNETFAARFFPNADPIGRHFGKYDVSHALDYEVVGVVEDAKYLDASRAVRPMFFVPLVQTVRYATEIHNKIEESSRYAGSIELYVHGDPDAMAPAIRAALAEVDPNLPPTRMASFPELIRVMTSGRTLTARLSDAFGATALLLAAIGLYGVTAYRVARRTGEFGMRMALGASRRDIAALVVRGALAQVGVGLLLGVPLAAAAAYALRAQLYGVSPFSVPILAVAAVMVITCACAASVLAARRAMTIAPMDALRAE